MFGAGGSRGKPNVTDCLAEVHSLHKAELHLMQSASSCGTIAR